MLVWKHVAGAEVQLAQVAPGVLSIQKACLSYGACRQNICYLQTTGSANLAAKVLQLATPLWRPSLKVYPSPTLTTLPQATWSSYCALTTTQRIVRPMACRETAFMWNLIYKRWQLSALIAHKLQARLAHKVQTELQAVSSGWV